MCVRLSTMPFPYEEFDLSGVRTYPLKSRPSKANVQRFCDARRAERRPSASSSTRCRTCSPPPISRRSSRRIVDRARRGGRHRLGARRARDQDRPRAGADRADGARLRVGHRDQRRRRHSRFRDRARRRHVGGRRRSARPGPFGMADETGRLLNGAITDGVGRGLGIGQAVGALSCRAGSRSMRDRACSPRQRGSGFR